MAEDEDPKKKKWSDLVGAVGRDLAKLGGGLQKALREATDSEAAKQLKGALAEVGPQVKKAAQSIGPELQKVVDQVRPDVERAVSQLRPEVERLVGEAKPVVRGAIDELLGRSGTSPGTTRPTASSHPNISPDVAPDADHREADEAQDDDEGESTRPDAQAADPADTPRSPQPAKTLGRRSPRKGNKPPGT